MSKGKKGGGRESFPECPERPFCRRRVRFTLTFGPIMTQKVRRVEWSACRVPMLTVFRDGALDAMCLELGGGSK